MSPFNWCMVGWSAPMGYRETDQNVEGSGWRAARPQCARQYAKQSCYDVKKGVPQSFCMSISCFFELCKLLYLIWKRTFRAIYWYKNLTNSPTDRYYLNVFLGPADLQLYPLTYWSVILQPLVAHQPTIHHMKGDTHSFHLRHISLISYERLQRY